MSDSSIYEKVEKALKEAFEKTKPLQKVERRGSRMEDLRRIRFCPPGGC